MKSHFHLAPLVVAVAVGAVTWLVAHRMGLNQRLKPPAGRLEGFAGWLAFLAAMQWLAVLHTLGDLSLSLGQDKLSAVASANASWRAGHAAAIVLQVLLFLFVLWCAIVMHRKSRLFPRLFRLEMVLLLLVPLANALMVTWEGEHGRTSPMVEVVYWVRVAVFAPAAGIGYVYSLRSVRFRNTFVR
jgi:hypothetical protein